jgi:hypothetical protein
VPHPTLRVRYGDIRRPVLRHVQPISRELLVQQLPTDTQTFRRLRAISRAGVQRSANECNLDPLHHFRQRSGRRTSVAKRFIAFSNSRTLPGHA